MREGLWINAECGSGSAEWKGTPMTSRPLDGLRVIDISGLAPGPFCTQILADFGAAVTFVEPARAPQFDVATFFNRGKRSIVIDLRHPDGVATIARLANQADVFVEGFRPGVAERVGLGPEELMGRNPRLIYTRLTGWGQTGPYRDLAGHDINYLAVAGALGAVGRTEPTPPLNLLGDFAGGSLMAVIGILMAVLDRHRTGAGQVVDAAIVDGAALLLAAQLAELTLGRWQPRDRRLLGGVAPFYGAYRCADDRWIAVGAIEPKFYAAFIERIGVEVETTPECQFDETRWADLRERVAAAFASRPRDEWLTRFEGADACTVAVSELDELETDPHLAARGTVARVDGWLEPAPAPRLSASPATAGVRPVRGAHAVEILEEAGFASDEIERLLASGAVSGAG
jgi:alpha-methylacyl-CoA racemase